ncbi:CFL1 Probable ferric reductase transmembrane component [Candida maltosa Xu316]
MNSKPVEQHDGFSTYPAKINDSETYYFKHAYEQFLGNYDISVDHGVYLFMYWVVVLVIVSLSNWFKIIFPGITKKLIDPVTNWFRKNITTPATNGKNKTNELPMGKFFDMLVPSRMETLILLGASIVCLKLLVVDIDYVENDPLFHTKREAILRFYAVRTSLLASALMPLLILFGGRNNFLQWVTRWDYSTFIMFHRWISRAVVGLIFIHSFFYAWYIKIRSVELQPYMFWGAAALWAGLAILVQGLLVLRRKWYEVFLLLHIVLAAVFVFGAWVHVNELYCVWFYYTSAAIWGFDRIIRICRLYSFGFPEAKVYLLPDDTLKVVVPKPENWEAVPGGHVFIHFLRWDCFWQSHPFTYVDSESHITLFIKVKKGVTKSLRDYLVLKHDKFTTIRVAVEGSYGESTPARYADTTFFIAGGSGIPGIYSEAVDLKKSNPNSRQKVKLIWVVRDYQSLLWFHEELLALKETNIDATIYVTRPNNAIDESTQLLSPQKVISEIKSICQVYEGRPNIGKLIEQQVEESTNSVAVITCGHPAMVDEVRYSTCQSIDNPQGKRVDYYEMLQVWA